MKTGPETVIAIVLLIVALVGVVSSVRERGWHVDRRALWFDGEADARFLPERPAITKEMTVAAPAGRRAVRVLRFWAGVFETAAYRIEQRDARMNRERDLLDAIEKAWLSGSRHKVRA